MNRIPLPNKMKTVSILLLLTVLSGQCILAQAPDKVKIEEEKPVADFGKWGLSCDPATGKDSVWVRSDNGIKFDHHDGKKQSFITLIMDSAHKSASMRIEFDYPGAEAGRSLGTLGTWRAWGQFQQIQSIAIKTKTVEKKFEYNKRGKKGLYDENIYKVSCEKDGIARVESWFDLKDIKEIVKSYKDTQIIELIIESRGRFKNSVQTAYFNTNGVKEVFSSLERQYDEYKAKKRLEAEKEKEIRAALEKEALEGNESAKMLLASLYNEERKYREAFKIFKSLSEGGNLDAMPMLINSYYRGIGTPQDPWEALMWANVAATLGSGQGVNWRALLNHEGYMSYNRARAEYMIRRIDEINASRRSSRGNN
jgi:hypothetical protein